MQHGILTVTGKGKTEIPLLGWPRDVTVCFTLVSDPVPCEPHHHHDDEQKHHGHHGHHGRPEHRDHLTYKIEHEDIKHKDIKYKRRGQHYHERRFFLEINWKVEGVREISWHVVY